MNYFNFCFFVCLFVGVPLFGASRAIAHDLITPLADQTSGYEYIVIVKKEPLRLDGVYGVSSYNKISALKYRVRAQNGVSLKATLQRQANIIDVKVVLTPISENTGVLGTDYLNTVVPASKMILSSVKPGTGTLRSPVNDPFYGYQWALENDGQIVINDIDDTHLRKVLGTKGVDTSWRESQSIIQQHLKRDVVVAVLDSGLNIDHEDLKNNIYINEAECTRGKISRGEAKEDKDGNGYFGDCMGWNFTTNHKTQRNRPFDDTGHGTHVAGIIAAESNNGVGISGFSNRIKILPLKVTFSGDGKGKEKSDSTLTDRVAAAMEYARAKKVDVINLSMGWPLRLDAEHLRDSFRKAIADGIIVVVAVGNNDNSSPIFPCAYKGVICVGSIDNDGQISEFSNFGGHVDLLAPGDNILSLFPKIMEPFSFSVKGYEIKSGTSQAAPYVSAIAAILKGIFPQANNNEILARMYLGTSRVPQLLKYSIAGHVKFIDAFKATPQPVVKPVFKELGRISIAGQSNTGTLKFPVKNFWKTSANGVLTIESLSPNIRFTNKKILFPALQSGEERDFSFPFEIKSLLDHSELKFKVTIEHQGQAETFMHQVGISTDLTKGVQLTKLAIDLPFMEGEVPALRTVPTYRRREPSLEYFTVEKSLEGKFVLNLLGKQGAKLNTIQSLVVPEALRVLNFFKIDLNYDGESDYLLRTIHKEEKEDGGYYIRYFYLDKNLRPLIADIPSFKLIDEGAYLDLRSLAFVKRQVGQHQLAFPAFVTSGFVPIEDEKLIKDLFFSNSNANRLFYFLPEHDGSEWRLRTRIVDNQGFEDRVKARFGLKYYHSVLVNFIMPQSDEMYHEGTALAYFSAGQGDSQKYIVVSLGEDTSHPAVGELNYPYGNLGVMNIASYTELTDDVLDFDAGVSVAGIFSTVLGSLEFISNKNPGSIFQQLRVDQPSLSDHILGFIHSYKKDDDLFSFYQTKSQILLKSLVSGKEVLSSKTLIRARFLQGQLFSETFFPIVKGQDEKTPALYVNATQLSSRHVYLWAASKDGQLKNPIINNIEVPEECRPMNPVIPENGKGFHYSMVCAENNQWVLKLWPVK